MLGANGPTAVTTSGSSPWLPSLASTLPLAGVFSGVLITSSTGLGGPLAASASPGEIAATSAIATRKMASRRSDGVR